MPEPSSTRPDYELLLHSGIQAARRGQRATARALFLAITREHPSAVRAWLALAGVAEGREEQRAALEQALLLEPTNTLARQALERLDRLASEAQAAAPAVQAAPAPPSADERDDFADLDSRLANGPQVALPYAEQADEEPAAEPAYLRRIPGWLVIAALAAAIGLALGYFLLPGFGSQPPTASPPTPPLVLLPTAAGVAEPTPAPAQTSSATALPPQPTSEPTSLLPTPRPVLEPTLAPAAPLAMGTLQEYDSWSATLLRPDYALALDRSIGDLQPSGRFVFALLSVSNGGATARRLPPDIFSLVDQQGRRYSPVGGASTAYLALFGRGQYGDLAFEDEVAAGGSLFSVPVIFDVPPDATGLILTVGRDASAGWQVQEGSASTQSPNIGP